MPALPAASAPALDWFASTRGAHLLACEAQGLAEIGLRSRGGRALTLCGSASPAFELEFDGPRAQLSFGFDRRTQRVCGGLHAAVDALPFCRESFGLILAWHLPSQPAFARFDFAQAAELLQPEGELLLVGLNPMSAWRLHWQRYGLAGMRAGALRSRIQAAGLEVRAVRGLGPRWPWGGGPPAPVVVQSPQLCASVLVQLRKRRPGLTPLPARRALAPARAGMT